MGVTQTGEMIYMCSLSNAVSQRQFEQYLKGSLSNAVSQTSNGVFGDTLTLDRVKFPFFMQPQKLSSVFSRKQYVMAFEEVK